MTFTLRDVRGDRVYEAADAHAGGAEERRLDLALENGPGELARRERPAPQHRAYLIPSASAISRQDTNLKFWRSRGERLRPSCTTRSPVREIRAERRARHVEAVRLRHAVDAALRVGDDVEEADEGVVALAPIHGVVVGALVRQDDEALAVLSRQIETPSMSALRPFGPSTRSISLRSVPPSGSRGIPEEAAVLFGDVERAGLVVRDAAFGLRADREFAHLLADGRAALAP